MRLSTALEYGPPSDRLRKAPRHGVSTRAPSPLEQIVASKRASGRPKDLAAIPALEEAIAAVRGEPPIP